MEGKPNKSLSRAMRDMCHKLIERKSKVMDKRIRKSKGANKRLTCGKGGHSHLTMLDQTSGEEKGEKKEKRERGERSSNFSLRSMEIGGSVLIGLRTKDHLLDKGYACVPKTRDFIEDSSEEFRKSRVLGLGSVHETS